MREIKFRAWDKEKKRFAIVSFTNEEVLLCIDGNDSFILSSEHVITQFTGLKDKNGKEIYEGDICIIDYQEEGVWKSNIGEIGFRKGCFNFIFKDESFIYLNEDGNYFNIIGNIYENPELLTQSAEEKS